MKKVSIDRRTIRTKKMIRSALAELIDEKGFNNISVTDLTQRADINRGTFYLHYVDKYDLLEKIENEIIQEIEEETKHLDSVNMMNIDASNEPLPFRVKLFEYFRKNSVIIKSILGPKGDPTFERKIKRFIEINLFEKQKLKNFNIDEAVISEEYFIQYILSADLGVIQYWLEKNMKESPDEMALILARMSLLGPLRAVGIRKDS
ncbi:MULTISPECIES: TetR/AcrR family transcriptional regulator C-terminal domain-containing protein [unclassified Clostridioides]|uniref:TetR/AcrR family transcriptional regulator n=1 Tax=unclassified Clostridioides TaxID=2635829 RepID=UPI001D1283F9|nr:TetR/AcrR family transcriptional regulator C-terminal domain-containing protein [Clostridioides sp. ZZV14-6150]MCC0722619.1 TetR/AcrR family transcriptional regulator C-terminal domain-containing protein [Clostridioides sp. ZZV14-6104]MCC0744366.1 TetR/AcrR family transcriptional regulator C-terminal domain-containing protein [Clostridioides sp. ZZV14-6044]MCC0752414.1 TetR/AcrR family transcriptional regulator C-terminal domain-containing protein [Clostridioides sp. ZZV13-5731]